MRKGYLINENTGEIIKDEDGKTLHNWRYVASEHFSQIDNVRTRVNVSGGTFTEDNIGYYKEITSDVDETDTEEEHPIFGKYLTIDSRRKFTKAYHLEHTEFSKPSFTGYWFTLILHLSKNTNVIYIYDKIIRPCYTKQDLIRITESRPATFYRFYREAEGKGYLSQLKIENRNYWIMNPTYAFNGWRMPELLLDLFNDPLKYEV